MDPLTSAAVSWGAGKIAGLLTPSRGGQARRRTEQAQAQLDGYRTSYDGLTRQGRETLDGYTPRLNTAVDDYQSYLDNPYGSDSQDAATLANETEGLNMDARRAAARVARSLPLDSEASGATAGALTAIEDRNLSGTAAARARITEANLMKRERGKQAIVSLLADQVARGRGDFLTGLQGGQGISSGNLQAALNQENQALQQDGAAMQGWQQLAAELARGSGGKK